MISNSLYEYISYVMQIAKSTTTSDIKYLILNAPQIYREWWLHLYYESPHHIIIETALVLFIIWLLFIRKTIDPVRESKNKSLTKKEEEWLIETWKPAPLVEPQTERNNMIASEMIVIESVKGNFFTLQGYSKPVLNLTTFDFLGLAQHPATKKASLEAVNKYGVGSCGPRGFYGTIDVHLLLENKLAQFMGFESAIYYSDSSSTVSSAITSFLKKGDLIVADEACNDSIRNGCNLSRATVVWYKHNDMTDLQTILKSIADDDKRLKRNSLDQRRFIVTEGLFRMTGDICPLKELLTLKNEFCYRLILDESLSIGTLGKTGRGITELQGVDVKEVELVAFGLDTAIGSVGGACLGSYAIVDHQRLSGPGYCFSASAPPFFAAAALAAIECLEKDSSTLLGNLHQNSQRLINGLQKIKGFKVASTDITPVIHLTLLPTERSWEDDEAIIARLVHNCLSNGVGVTTLKLQQQFLDDINKETLRPSLRICVSSVLSASEIDKAIATLTSLAKEVLGSKKK